jgi:hypothetical protein
MSEHGRGTDQPHRVSARDAAGLEVIKGTHR